MGQPQGIAPTIFLNQKRITGAPVQYKPNIHHRRSIRLKGYDYSQAGLYFITICIQNRLCLFGEIDDGAMVLNNAGEMVHGQWLALADRFHTVELDEFIVMPNHFHGIIELIPGHSDIGQPQGIAPTGAQSSIEQITTTEISPAIGDVIGAFKSLSTNDYIAGVKQKNWQPFDQKLWQRNYYEHVIRSEQSYLDIVEYIRNNPLKWAEDKYYNK